MVWAREEMADDGTPPGWVYSYNVGVEAEAANRSPTKNFQTLRADLAVLPWLLAGKHDFVIAPPPRAEFLESLRDAGVTDLPTFISDAGKLPKGRRIAGHRPWGVVGPHLRRSNVASYREDVIVCRSLDEVRSAIATVVAQPYRQRPEGARCDEGDVSSSGGPTATRAVLKAEYSSSGHGVRVCEVDVASGPALRAADEGWARNLLQRDGALTVEPFIEILMEFSGEWLCGEWCGLSLQEVTHLRWNGTRLEEPTATEVGDELYDFVYHKRAVEAALRAWDVPGRCGMETCGMDCAVVRSTDGSGALEVQALEVNARTTMNHYAQAARRRVPGATHFGVVRASELPGQPDLLPLTDPQAATTGFCAVVWRRAPMAMRAP